MASINNIRASDGTGPAARASVTNSRAVNNPTILVDTLTNWPSNFIGVTGTPDLVNQTIIPSTLQVFYGHESGGTAIIDSFAEGYTDLGNSVGDILILKPTTAGQNELAEILSVSHEDNGDLTEAAVKKALNIPDTAPADWTILATPPSAVVTNGNGSYDLTIPSVDYTDRLNPGTRLRTVRGIAAPTQSAAINGTNQYFSKTSPAGMTFTDDFAAGAWVKLDRYTGASSGVITRFSGTNGWGLIITGIGEVNIFATNANSNSRIISNQSIPLNKWVHISAQLDMSAYTATPTTSYIMIDGVNVPATISRDGSNPTSLIQAGNLEVGSFNGGTAAFPGKIAQAAVFGTKITQATMRSYISQGLAGTEPGLISAYSLSNSLTDLNTTNANNLTAQNAATTTNADSPFGNQANDEISATVDYGIVTKAVVSGSDTTVTVQTPSGNTIPTSGGIATISYSSVKAPYGMPIDPSNWAVNVYNKSGVLSAAATASSWYNSQSIVTTLPVGTWNIYYQGSLMQTNSTSGGINTLATLSKVNNAISDADMTVRFWPVGSTTTAVAAVFVKKNITVTTPTPFYLLHSWGGGAGTVTLGMSGNVQTTVVGAEFTLL